MPKERAQIAILAPSPILTVTIEPGDESGPETHYHPGGQGVWVAHMAAALEAEVVLCVALAGEAGTVLEGLLEAPRIEVRSTAAHGRSGSYVHDRRSGERVVVASTDGPRLWRHETDELYGATLAAGLEAGTVALTGPQPPDALPPDFYRRLAVDLGTNGVTVIGDLTGGALEGALAGRLELLKISHEELIAEGLAEGPAPEQLLAGIRELRHRGARGVIISRAAEPALAMLDGRLYELAGPRLEPSDPTGAGDSMFAGIAVALADERSIIEAFKLGVAAGALNVTRRGLGTGRRTEVERLLPHVHVSDLGNVD